MASSSRSKSKRVPGKKRRFTLTLAVLIQNEALWLPEWLEYHLLPRVGVDHIYLYDDASQDQLQAVVEPYTARGQVTLLHEFTKDNVRPEDFRRVVPLAECKKRNLNSNFESELSMFSMKDGTCYKAFMMPPLKACVRHAIEHYGAATTWMAFIDVDEYLVVGEHYASIPALLATKHADDDAVRMFGDIMLQGTTPREGDGTLLIQRSTRAIVLQGDQSAEMRRREKIILRPESADVDAFGSVHNITLLPGHKMATVYRSEVHYAHFRYRNFSARHELGYINGRWAHLRAKKLLQLQGWERERELAMALAEWRRPETALLGHVDDVMTALCRTWWPWLRSAVGSERMLPQGLLAKLNGPTSEVCLLRHEPISPQHA